MERAALGGQLPGWGRGWKQPSCPAATHLLEPPTCTTHPLCTCHCWTQLHASTAEPFVDDSRPISTQSPRGLHKAPQVQDPPSSHTCKAPQRRQPPSPCSIAHIQVHPDQGRTHLCFHSILEATQTTSTEPWKGVSEGPQGKHLTWHGGSRNSTPYAKRTRSSGGSPHRTHRP